MSHGDSRSVLIIHPGALGDVLLALPAMQALRNRYPSHRMVLIAGLEVGRLFQICQVVDKHLSIDSGYLAGLFAGGGLPSSLRQELEQCDRVIGWLRDGDGSLRAVLEAAGISQIAVDSPTPRPGIHQSKRFMEVVDWLPADRTTEAGLSLPALLKRAGSDRLRSMGFGENRRLVLCHPGSGSFAKCIRPDVMAATIRRFRGMELTPLIVSGPADDDVVQSLTGQELDDVPVMQHQPLEILAGVLAHARMFIGHDSGVTHLAAALRVPTLALFGPTDPHQWAPQGDHVSVVSGQPCSCENWEQVRACAERPCLSISPETIVRSAVSTLARYQSVTKS